MINRIFFQKKEEIRFPLSFEWNICYILIPSKSSNMSHVTRLQRYTISVMYQQGYKQKEIASAISKDKSVISREIKRNSDGRSGEYKYELAQRKCENRHKSKPKYIRLTKEVKSYINKKLAQEYSPEQIYGRSFIERELCVSHETIYQYIIKDKKQGGDLYRKLRRRKKYRKRLGGRDKRGKIPNRVGIENRPAVVDKRRRIGDLEIDTIIGLNHKGAIVSINDRVSGMIKLIKLESKDSKILAKKTTLELEKWQPYIKTITSDNGKEFAMHEMISEALQIDFYFADPYSSWQRGSNENNNGLVRQYFPKKHNFELITKKMLQEVETKLNNRPRKRFGYQTPFEVFNLLTKKVAFVA